MQNSIVSVYAEQKNKEVTSQEFLDYINQLKEQNPNFKFNQGETKVFDSEEQALANLAEQKQAINTAIANYKQALEELAELDVAVEEKKKELKKQKELDHFKEKIKDIVTTQEESQTEVDLWLGLCPPIKNKVAVLLTLAILMSVFFASFMVFENVIIKLAAIFLSIVSLSFMIVALFSFAEYEDKEALQKNRYKQLKEKTLSTDYTLDSDIIDCPIEVKKELLDRIDNGFVYLSVGFGNHHLYYYTETGYTEKGHSEKGYFGYLPNAFDNEYDYFKGQLTAYKLYNISDVIMDNARR